MTGKKIEIVQSLESYVCYMKEDKVILHMEDENSQRHHPKIEAKAAYFLPAPSVKRRKEQKRKYEQSEKGKEQKRQCEKRYREWRSQSPSWVQREKKHHTNTCNASTWYPQ